MSVSIFLSVAAVSLAACAIVMAGMAYQSMRRWQARHGSLEASIVALRREIELAASISARTGRRVQRVEHDFSDVVERVDVVESRGSTTSGSESLDRAIELARRGGDADEIAERFGLSSGEAELVARMHGRKKSA